MPIYKGSTEVTSGNLHKGSTEIQNGYKAADSFFVNETSLTITFTDNTPTGASMGTSSLVFNGTPGSSITQQVRTVSRAANYIIGTPVVTKTGDSNNDLNVATSLTGSTGFKNGLLTITGVLPSTNTTINLAVTCSSTAKITRTGSFTRITMVNQNSTIVTAQPVEITWSGGAPSTASLSFGATSNGLGGYGFQAGITVNNVNSTVVSSPPHTSVGIGAGGVTAGAQGGSGNGGGVNSGSGGAITRVTLGFSVGESATHKSFGTSSVIF
tara:strand:+ start:201 stop:1007 length:807 start_codon:yes stop_codon:yes gene_type:complete